MSQCGGHYPMTIVTKNTSKAQSPLHFARFEFKYLLPKAKREAVEGDMQYFLDYDPFVVDKPGHKYLVRSLYYDDPVYSCFHDKICGIRTRSKFRIRTYATDPDKNVPLYLEIKGRHNNLVFKHRTPIEKGSIDWTELQGRHLSDAVVTNIGDCPVREQFRFELARKRLSQVALIDYMRRPYLSKFDPGFRVTFDESLRATRTEKMFPSDKFHSKKVLAGYTVLEVKFRHHLPAWFHRVIQVHELRRISISKICAGMETLGLAYDEN